VTSWRRWVHGFFGLPTLEIWRRLFFLGESPEQVSEQLESIERKTAASSVAAWRP
jgi:hypothetical protein